MSLNRRWQLFDNLIDRFWLNIPENLENKINKLHAHYSMVTLWVHKCCVGIWLVASEINMRLFRCETSCCTFVWNFVLFGCTVFTSFDAAVLTERGWYDRAIRYFSSLYCYAALLRHAKGWYLRGAVRSCFTSAAISVIVVWSVCLLHRLHNLFLWTVRKLRRWLSIHFGVVMMIRLTEVRQSYNAMSAMRGAGQSFRVRRRREWIAGCPRHSQSWGKWPLYK